MSYTVRMGNGIAGYAHVNVCVTDVERAHDFYANKLGLEVLPRPDFGGFGGYWFRLGNSQLHLSAVKQMPEWNGAIPHLAVYIPTDEFEPTVEKFKGQGVEFIMGLRQREDFGKPVLTAFAKDPDGNVIEMTDVPPF
jgi:catechol 2,3-dioxygenase-like lactoylglutathione lyase family enzyme